VVLTNLHPHIERLESKREHTDHDRDCADNDADAEGRGGEKKDGALVSGQDDVSRIGFGDDGLTCPEF
jgi:hypothetical protein